MTAAEVITAARTLTGQDVTGAGTDADTQITDTQLLTFLRLEFARLRRRISKSAPTFYMTTVETPTLVQSGRTITKPADFERVLRLERKDTGGTVWLPIEVGTGLDAEDTTLTITGSFRLAYFPAMGTVNSGTTLSLPEGMELVLIHRLAGYTVRPRMEEDGGPHAQYAEAVLRDELPHLRQRYGFHPEGGIRLSGRTGYVYREEGSSIILLQEVCG